MKQVEVDIVIIGAGVAGFSAAVAASKKKNSVLLIESAGAIGGNAIQTNVGTICGAYYRTDTDEYKSVDHPMISFVLSALQLKPKLLQNGLIVTPYDVNSFHQFMMREIDNSKQIELWLLANTKKAYSVNGAVNAIEIEYDNEMYSVKANAFVDASGNGILSQLLEAPMLSSKTYQSASQVFEITGIESDNEFGLNMSIAKATLENTNTVKSFLRSSIVPGSLLEKSALIKFTIPHQITDQTDIRELKNLGEIGVKELFELLKSKVESMKNATLKRIFPLPGIRVLQRTKGQSTLTKNHVLNMKKVEGSIAQGTWPIEMWDNNGNVDMVYFEPNEYYDIPRECICSEKFVNLFMAGKNISATEEAIASARVIGTCLQTGYSAGLLASAI